MKKGEKYVKIVEKGYILKKKEKKLLRCYKSSKKWNKKHVRNERNEATKGCA